MVKRITDIVIVSPKKAISAQIFKAPPPTIKRRSPSRFFQKKYLWGIFIIAVALFAVILFSVFNSSLEVAVSPKKFQIPVAKTLALAKNEKTGQLLFKTLETPYSVSEKFQASESASTEVKAEGIVVIFNEAKDAQVLIASTRLEAPNKKIYKIPKTIVVPAAELKGGKLVPGSKEVKVLADRPGEDYNIGLTDFTLPGLKGSSKYDLVFARSKTEITGGALGSRTIVGKTDEEKASANLLVKAKNGLKEVASRKLPEEEILLLSSLEYVVGEKNVNPPVGSVASGAPAGEFEVTFGGKVRGVFVNRKNLESFLVGEKTELASFKNSFRVTNLDKLSFKTVRYNFDAENFGLQISGTAEVEYEIQKEKMADLIQKDQLDAASSILGAFPGLSRAEVKIRPFWLAIFGINPRGIDIILQGS